jgi:hypothetical protein
MDSFDQFLKNRFFFPPHPFRRVPSCVIRSVVFASTLFLVIEHILIIYTSYWYFEKDLSDF